MLASLTLQQAAPRFEVLVIDQNGDNRLDPVVKKFISRLAIRHEKVAFKGASQARNHGARLARGHWVGFPVWISTVSWATARPTSAANSPLVTGASA